MKIAFISLLLLTIPIRVFAADKIFLYENYYYGMSREEALEAGPLQCDDYPEGQTVCNRQNVKFADLAWTQFFEFHNNRLSSVAFGQRSFLKAKNAALAWLQEEKFLPVKEVADNEQIDLMSLYDKDPGKEFEIRAGKFIKRDVKPSH